MGRGSPAQLMHHSEDLRDRFSSICKRRQPQGTRVRDLRAAKHRFESLQKPLGRTIRLLPCIFELMMALAVERSDGTAKTARDWLTWLAATPRNILLGAMMADAADEAMSVVRFCDDESIDPAFLADQVATFLSRVE